MKPSGNSSPSRWRTPAATRRKRRGCWGSASRRCTTSWRAILRSGRLLINDGSIEPMRISVKTKQIMAVTAIVFCAVALMGVFYLLSLADHLVQESRIRADLMSKGIYNRAAALAREGGDLREKL